MKKFISILLAVSIVFAFAACGKKTIGNNKTKDEVYTDGDFDFVILEDGTAKITSFHANGHYDELKIPSEFTNPEFNAVSDAVESEETAETSETTEISPTIKVTVIGEGAFAESQDIEYVDFSKNIKIIEKRAFAGSSIKNAIMVSSRKLEKIGEEAFAGCPELVQIDVSASVTDFGVNCFANNEKLAVVTFRGNQEVDNSIFAGSKPFMVSTYKENDNIFKFAEVNNYEIKSLNG